MCPRKPVSQAGLFLGRKETRTAFCLKAPKALQGILVPSTKTHVIVHRPRVRWPGAAAEPRGEGPECSGLEVTELGGTTELQPQGDIHPSEAPGTTGECVLQESQASAMLTMPWAWAGPGPAAPMPPWEPELLLSLGAEFPAPFLLYFLSLEEATKQELR